MECLSSTAAADTIGIFTQTTGGPILPGVTAPAPDLLSTTTVDGDRARSAATTATGPVRRVDLPSIQ